METIEQIYTHFLTITHDRMSAAILTLATALKDRG